MRIYTKPVTFGGSTKNGSPYHKFKQDIRTGFQRIKDEPFDDTRNVSVKIRLFIHKERIGPDRNDLDNFLKPIIDALEEADALVEHKIDSIRIDRKAVPDENEEGVEIFVSKK